MVPALMTPAIIREIFSLTLMLPRLALKDAGGQGQHFEHVPFSQLVCRQAQDPGSNGLFLRVDNDTAVLGKFEVAAVLPAYLLFCFHNNGFLHLKE